MDPPVWAVRPGEKALWRCLQRSFLHKRAAVLFYHSSFKVFSIRNFKVICVVTGEAEASFFMKVCCAWCSPGNAYTRRIKEIIPFHERDKFAAVGKAFRSSKVSHCADELSVIRTSHGKAS